MANNYSSDPKKALLVNKEATPASGSGTTMPELPRHLPHLVPGTELSNARYKIERLVAAGGMGAVYRAIDTRFNRPCAVKEMLDQFQNESDWTLAVKWFSREATLLLDLNHACIPRVRDFFVELGKHYLVMDFIDGRTMAEVLEKEGNVVGVNGARGVPEARARSWGQQLCSVLNYLHRQTPPIIFRDLKLTNIMVTERDEVKLIDFGIARPFQSQLQATIIMTIGYAPPEQLHGMPEPRSDLYALGATLHKLLTHHDAASNKPSIFSFPPTRMLRPDISVAFERVIMKALSPMLEQRWSSAIEMERAIINLPPITVTPPLAATMPVTPHSKNPQTPHVISVPGSDPGGAMSPGSVRTTGPAAAHIQAASGHLGAGRIEAAYAAINQAYALEPNNAVVHKLYGQVFARRQPPQTDLALQAYGNSLRLDPDHAETHKLIGDAFLFLRQQPAQAIPAYAKSLQLNSQNFESHQRLAQCFERLNPPDLPAALREYQEAARLAPGSPVVQYALGQLALRMKQFPLAEHAFVQVLTINPADHQTRFLLSHVYESENKFEDAFRECNYVLQPLGATNPAVRQMFQRLRVRLGR